MLHFIYTRKVRKQVPATLPSNISESDSISAVSQYQEVEFKESFNLEKVVRSVMRDVETLVVLLDDGHEESIELQPEQRNDKGKIVKESIKKRLFFASEIELKGNDITRFFEAIEHKNINS